MGILVNEIEREQEKLSDDLQRLEDLQQETERGRAKIERHARKAHPLLSTMTATIQDDADALDFAVEEARSAPATQVFL